MGSVQSQLDATAPDVLPQPQPGFDWEWQLDLQQGRQDIPPVQSRSTNSAGKVHCQLGYSARNICFSQKSSRRFSQKQLLLHLAHKCPISSGPPVDWTEVGWLHPHRTSLHSVSVCLRANVKNLTVRALTLLLICLFPFKENKLFSIKVQVCDVKQNLLL